MSLWGHVSQRLMDTGAKGVLLNFSFQAETEVDDSCRVVISNHAPRVLLGGGMVEIGNDMAKIQGPSPSLVSSGEFGDNTQSNSVGLVTVHTESDWKVRRGLYWVSYHDMVLTVAPQMADQLVGASFI